MNTQKDIVRVMDALSELYTLLDENSSKLSLVARAAYESQDKAVFGKALNNLEASVSKAQTTILNGSLEIKFSLLGLVSKIIDCGICEPLNSSLSSFMLSGGSDQYLTESFLLEVISAIRALTTGDARKTSRINESDELAAIASAIVSMLDKMGLEEKLKSEVEELKKLLCGKPDIETVKVVLGRAGCLSHRSSSIIVKEFIQYLRTVFSKLELLSSAINSNASLVTEMEETTKQFSGAIGDGVNLIRKEVAESEDLDQLKSRLNSEIEKINSAREEHDFMVASRLKKEQDDTLKLKEKLKAAERDVIRLKRIANGQRVKALTDSLTGLPNRESYKFAINKELELCQKDPNRRDISVAVLDLDNFKSINDNHGHHVGDKILTRVAESLKANLRSTDFVGRYGGEEFIVILKEDLAAATKTINNVRLAIFQEFEKEDVKVTLSGGVSQLLELDTERDVFKRADTGLYRAKRRGRNLICPQLKAS